MTGSSFHTLDMFFRERLIGHLQFDSLEEQFQISYTKQWQQDGFALSPHLPLDGSAKSFQISNFLVNLLPENQGLDYLIEYLSVSKNNVFALVKGIGFDTSGAISFVLHGSVRPKTSFIPINSEDLLKRLNDPDIWPLEVWDGKPRLSVAGVQSKLNLFLHDDKYGFGEGNLSSTHIIKFEKDIHQHLVINEFVSMRLAHKAGFKVANVVLMKIDNHRALCVERFDRRYDETNNVVNRRHMIDACQALGFSVNKKYERNFGDGRDVAHIREGVSLTKLFGLTALCTIPAASKLDMLQWVIFNLCICNYDSHGKNYSFFVNHKGLQPTPWYDLVNVKMYPQFDQSLAMAIGDEFIPSDINAYQLVEFAADCSMSKTLLITVINQVCLKIQKHLDNAISDLPDLSENEQLYILHYRTIISEQCKHFLEQAEIIPKIEL